MKAHSSHPEEQMSQVVTEKTTEETRLWNGAVLDASVSKFGLGVGAEWNWPFFPTS